MGNPMLTRLDLTELQPRNGGVVDLPSNDEASSGSTSNARRDLSVHLTNTGLLFGPNPEVLSE